jgi:hypothetical protein
MAWGRTTIAGPQQNGAAEDGKSDGQPKENRRLVNVLATGSVDQVSGPLTYPSCRYAF